MNGKLISKNGWSKMCSAWATGVLLAAMPLGVLAQEGSELELFWDPADLIISSTRTPKKLSKAPALATVITADQLRRIGAQTLLDVVRRLPGFNISITNINNPVIDVRGMKSYNSEKLLLMIDGHRVNEAHSGGAAWTFTDMPLDNVERIEVIRGPGSALYGENAFSGVINVFTRRYQHDKIQQENDKNFISLAGGTEDTRKASFFVGTAGEDYDISGFAHFYKTSGFSLEVQQDVLSLSRVTAPFSITPHPTEDWKEQQDFDLWTSWKNLTLHTRYMHKNQGPYINITDVMTDGSQRNTDHFFADLEWKESFGESVDVTATLFFDHHTMDNYWVGYPAGFFRIPQFTETGLIGNPSGKYRTYGVELVANMEPVDNHQVTMGAIHRTQTQFDIQYIANFDTTARGIVPIELQEVSKWGNWQSEDDYKENDWSLFGQDDWTINDDLSIIYGLRFDKYEEFDDVLSPRAGLIWQANVDTTFKLLYGHAYRAPSFVDRFTSNNPAYIGNPDLEPETIDTVEGAVAGKLLGLEYDLGVYYSDYKDVIVLGEKPSPTEPAQYENRDNATSHGLEVSLSKNVTEALTAKANYSYQKLEGDETENPFPGFPVHQGNIEVEWQILDKTFLNTHLYWCGKRERSDTDIREDMDGFELVNVTLLVQDIVIDGLELQVKVNNLFDEEYEDPAPENTIYYDYPRPGINALLELKYSF